MNVLFLSSKKRWAGIITWNISLARKFKERGHKCLLVSAKNSALTKNAPEDVVLIPLKFGFNFNPLTFFRLIRIVKKNNIDVIVTNIKREVIFGGIAGRICKIPVVRLIGNEKDFDSGRFYEEKLVDTDIFPCEYTRKLSVEKFPWLPFEKTKVIHTGKTISAFPKETTDGIRDSWGASGTDIVIGASDRLSKEKGIHVLIEAFSGLCEEYKNIRLVITGTGKYENDLKELVRIKNLGERVHFAGFTKDVMLSASGYDIAVLASFFESFPNTVVEYMASNTAVICTDVGGVSEIVKDGFNGFLIPHNDAGILTERLRTLIDNAVLRKDFASRALETVRTGFTEDVMAEKTFEVFYSLTGSKK
jgi:glycosyltransferase involved in cell wall biosynthesis